MSESDTMFNERDRRWTAVQLMLSTDPSYDNRTFHTTARGTTTLCQNRQVIIGYAEVLYIPHIPGNRASPSDDLLSYPRHSLGGGLFLCGETGPGDEARCIFIIASSKTNLNTSKIFHTTTKRMTTPCQNRQVINGNAEVLYIPQSFGNGASPSDDFLSYPRHSLGGGLFLCRETDPGN